MELESEVELSVSGGRRQNGREREHREGCFSRTNTVVYSFFIFFFLFFFLSSSTRNTTKRWAKGKRSSQRDEERQVNVRHKVDSLTFDLLTRLNGQYTTKPRVLSHDLLENGPWSSQQLVLKYQCLSQSFIAKTFNEEDLQQLVKQKFRFPS